MPLLRPFIWPFWGVFFAAKFADRQSRLARNDSDGKHQEHADNFRNLQKINASKNADIKAPIANLQVAERNQPHQTPSYEMGGGGNRAAWRIQIRRPLGKGV